MNWLVTGGCGFIGANLIGALHAQGGHRIRVVDDCSVGSPSDLAERVPLVEVAADDALPMSEGDGAGPVELVRADVRNEELAPRLAEGADVVVHLAASAGVDQSVADPRRDCSINVLGTLNTLEAARVSGVSRFVFASSSAPIGEVTPPIHEELAPHPASPYGAGKLAGEGYCSAYFRCFGIETVALRFGNVYGPGSRHKSSVVARFIRAALAGETLEIYGDGSQTRDFVYVGDLVRAIQAAATEPDVGGEIFQIATSRETTVGELVDELLPCLRRAGVEDVQRIHASPRAGDVRRSFSDTSKALARLGWKAEVPLHEGLQATLDWFLAERGARS